MTTRLSVLLSGRIAGVLERAGDSVSFRYDDDYRSLDEATPLSTSMPLRHALHGSDVVLPYLAGLLPDNDRVLQRWAREHQTSANPFSLLAHVGEDVAGAVQIVRPERIDHAMAEGGVERLHDDDVADHLRRVREDSTAWHGTRAADMRWSLAGAQAKIALALVDGGWGLPTGRAATTHILKPAITGFDDHDLNEHLCLEAAAQLGFPIPRTWVATFGDERAIVVERYDRIPGGDGQVVRLHQEDLCQALAVHPSAKYQADGGPTVAAIGGHLRTWVTTARVEDDLRAFALALGLSWLLGGIDAHAKNYSLLLAGRQVRLAPFYDIASGFPYDIHLRKMKLAMKIGGEYHVAFLEARHWDRCAKDVGVPAPWLRDELRSMAERLPDALSAAAAVPEVAALGSALPARLVDAVADWCRRCLATLDAAV